MDCDRQKTDNEVNACPASFLPALKAIADVEQKVDAAEGKRHADRTDDNGHKKYSNRRSDTKTPHRHGIYQGRYEYADETQDKENIDELGEKSPHVVSDHDVFLQ